MELFVQDPAEKIERAFDWDDLYLQEGETLASSAWAIDPDGPTLSEDSKSGAVTQVTVTGGTAGYTYVLTNTVVTSEGRIVPRSMAIRMTAR